MNRPHPPPPARIVVVGSVNSDLVVRVPALPRPGETVLGGRFTSAGGGKGANQAVAAARAGGRTTLVARVGNDDLGRAALASFEAEGIDTANITIDPHAPTGVALILVDSRGENAIAVAAGANDRLTPADIDAAAACIASADAVLIQLEIPLETVWRAVEVARAAGRRVILNPAPARPLPADLLGSVDVLTPNETEAAILSGVPVHDAASAGRAAVRLLEAGPAAVVITLGAAGALVADRSRVQQVPAVRVTAIDTVAAGDVFSGCLAVALAEGHDLVSAAAFAAAAAALSVTREGAQASAPTRLEIENVLAAGVSI